MNFLLEHVVFLVKYVILCLFQEQQGEVMDEVLEIPPGEVHQLSGKGGATIRTVEAQQEQ